MTTAMTCCVAMFTCPVTAARLRDALAAAGIDATVRGVMLSPVQLVFVHRRNGKRAAAIAQVARQAENT